MNSSFMQRYGWVLAFLVAAAIPVLLFGSSYILSIFVTIAIYGIVVVSLDLLMGFGGLPTFGHTGFFALGAYVMGVLAVRAGVPLPLGILAGLVVNLALAALIGFATLRLKEYYFAVATLGFAVIVIQVIGGLPQWTNGWSGLSGWPGTNIFGYAVKDDLQFYVLACAGALLSIALGRSIIVSRFGRAIRAIADDELAAEMLGIPAARHKIQLFMVSAAFASLAGSLYALFLRVVTPANFDIPIMVELVLMMFLGGRRTLWGGLIGAAVVRLLPEALGPFQDFKVLLQGLIFVLILIFVPRGIGGTLVDFWHRRRPAASSATVTLVNGTAEPLPLSRGVRRDRPTPGEVLLDVRGVSKHFGGLKAVSNLSLQVRAGQIKAIIGPNGAGKTTAFNLLTCTMPCDGGTVLFRGASLEGRRPSDVARLGMARTFQTPRLFTTMTVLENVLVGYHTLLATVPGESVIPYPSVRKRELAMRADAVRLLALGGLSHRADAAAQTLPFGERRILEIVRALALRPSLLLLDEPAAGLNETEKEVLGNFLLRLRDEGLTVLIVEHDMRLVMRIADEVLVMDQGMKIADGEPSMVQQDEAVMRAYLGTEVAYAAR